jgi:signal transduction histidine kinase
MMLESVGNQSSGRIVEVLRETHSLVNEVMARVHDLSLDLRPTMLDDLGLLPALLWHTKRYSSQTEIAVRLEHESLEGRGFPVEIETAAYRIVQEALTNIARHSQAHEAAIRLKLVHDSLLITIEDHGIGFEVAAALNSKKSSGLSGMMERAKLIGGQFSVESFPGKGTRLIVDLPVTTVLSGEGKGND